MHAESRAVAARPQNLTAPAVRRLILADFRSYPALDLALDAHMIVLTGENGAGKTNVLEALVAVFARPRPAPRRARRMRAEPRQRRFRHIGRVEGSRGRVQLGAGLEPPDGEGRSPPLPHRSRPRRPRPGRLPITCASSGRRRRWTRSSPGLPASGGGFSTAWSSRSIPTTAPRVNALERALRNRNRLLEEGAADRRWLEATEHEVAELAVTVAAARARYGFAPRGAHLGGAPAGPRRFPSPRSR